MAPIELLLPNALSISSEALSVLKPQSFPQLEALDTSIQTPIKADTHFTDPEGMEGWVDPLLSLGFDPATTGTRKESPAL